MCSVQKGSLPLKFEWQKDGVVLHFDMNHLNHKKIEYGDDYSSLIMPNVLPSDAGNFSCLVSNSFGRDVLTFVLHVSGLS